MFQLHGILVPFVLSPHNNVQVDDLGGIVAGVVQANVVVTLAQKTYRAGQKCSQEYHCIIQQPFNDRGERQAVWKASMFSSEGI